MTDPGPTHDDTDLSPEERADIDGMYLRLASSTLYELLDVPGNAERRVIRDAFFALSKRFHPDAYYGRNLGRWKPRVEQIFREASRAYEVLSDRNQRAEYDAYLEAHELTSQVSADMLPAESSLAARAARSAPNASATPAAVAPQAPPPRAASERPADARATTLNAAAAPPPPVATRPSIGAPPVAAPGRHFQFDPEAARASAREALSRKLRGGRPSSGSLPAQRPPGAASDPIQRASTGSIAAQRPPLGTGSPSGPPPRGSSPATPAQRPAAPARSPSVEQPRTGPSTRTVPPPALPRSVAAPTVPPPARDAAPPRSTPADGVSPLESFRAMNDAKNQNQRRGRLEALLSAADEALALNDLIAASNALSVARSLAPDDPHVRERADHVAHMLAASLAVKFIEQARYEERSGAWLEAAASWQKAWLGRNSDAGLLVRAANALLRAGKDMPRAAELARRATQLDPNNAEAFVTLARVFLAGKLRESAVAALETAAKLDPGSSTVKDLLARARK